MTTVVYSYTQSVTYVTDNILKSLKDIIRMSGLDPTAFVGKWATYTLAIKTWLESKHLEQVILEIYHPTTNALISRWDVNIEYGWGSGDGSFWTDTEQLRYNIKKAGIQPQDAKYSLSLITAPGRPAVNGWGPSTLRPIDGFVRQSLGSTIEHSGLGAQAAYWRKA
jgi:hypothetical protein